MKIQGYKDTRIQGAVGLILVAGLLFLGVSVSAQDLEFPAQVAVRELRLDKVAFQNGEEVRGGFIMENQGKRSIGNVYYVVILAGGYQPNGLPTKFYGDQTFGPVFLSVGEKKRVEFSSTLPTAVSGDDLGIRVQAFLKTGYKMGWDNARISVAAVEDAAAGGELAFAEITEPAVVVGDKTYSPEEGPTVPQGASAAYTFSLRNPSEVPMRLTPSVSIYRRSFADELLKQYNEAAIELAPRQTMKVSFALPLFDGTAGVYAGRVEFRDPPAQADKAGVLRAPPVTFRYIVAGSAGEIVSIESLTADKESARRGEDITVTVEYSGAPADIEAHTIPTLGKGSITVILRNEENKEVGRGSREIDLDDTLTPAKVVITATAEARRLNAQAVIERGGKALARHETSLSPEPAPKRAVLVNKELALWVLAALATAVVAIVAWKRRRT